jgi:hypothetical protein
VNHRLAFLFALMTVTSLGGCSSTFAPANDNLQAASAEFDVPPKEMVEKIRAALSTPPDDIGVVEQNKGTLTTGFQRFPGEWHIGRRWQEQTRYAISVVPDFDQPTARSRVEIREQTQTRAAEGMKWEPLEADRQERATALLERIRQQVR